MIVDRLAWSRASAAAVNIGVGSRDEPKEEHGIAHLLEHLLFKGTKSRSSKEMSELIEAAGGEMNAYTSKEVTSYYVSTLDYTFPQAQKLLAEIICQPLLAEKDIANEKKVVTQEIRMSEEDPDDHIHDLLAKTAWKGNPMARPEAGHVDCVARMSAEQILDFFQSNYRPPNLVVVATGNVNDKQVMEWTTAGLDPLQKAKKRKARVPPRFRPSVDVYPKEGEQVYVGIGFPGVQAAHPDRYVQGLLGGVLGAGTSSRLFQNVREEHGLVYSIYANAHPFTDCGIFNLYFSTSAENAGKVMHLIGKEFVKLKQEGLVEGELDRARSWIKGMIVRRLEQVEARMFFLGELYLQAGTLMTEDDVMENLDMVTPDQVEGMASSLLDRRMMCVAIHSEEKQGDSLAKSIEGLDF